MNVSVTAARRVGLGLLASLCTILGLSVSLAESNTCPSPISIPVKKSSFFGRVCFSNPLSLLERCFGGAGNTFSRRFLSASSNFKGPSGRMRPSSPSSSLSPVRQLEALGLKAETEELGLDRASLRVPPNRVPRLPSAHSMSRSSVC